MATRARKSGTAKRTRGGGRRSSPESAAATPTPDPVDAARVRTAFQDAFAIEYVVDHNGAGAYRRASGGQRSQNAKVRASQMLALPQVQAKIAELESEQLGDAKRRKGIRIGALMRTALDPDVRTSDRLRAIELSGKIDGDFVEQHEVTVLNEGRAERMKRGRARAAGPIEAAPGMVS